MNVHGFDGDDNLLHVVGSGRITGAEIEAHTIALDGHMDEENCPDPPTRPVSQSREGRTSGRDGAKRDRRRATTWH